MAKFFLPHPILLCPDVTVCSFLLFCLLGTVHFCFCSTHSVFQLHIHACVCMRYTIGKAQFVRSTVLASFYRTLWKQLSVHQFCKHRTTQHIRACPVWQAKCLAAHRSAMRQRPARTAGRRRRGQIRRPGGRAGAAAGAAAPVLARGSRRALPRWSAAQRWARWGDH